MKESISIEGVVRMFLIFKYGVLHTQVRYSSVIPTNEESTLEKYEEQILRTPRVLPIPLIGKGASSG
jgi:hypothetical protein